MLMWIRQHNAGIFNGLGICEQRVYWLVYQGNYRMHQEKEAELLTSCYSFDVLLTLTLLLPQR